MSDTPPYPSFTKRFHNKAQPSTSATRPELSAKGKSVMITGGGVGGIGGETARYFAAAGASRIAILGRRQQPLADNKAFIEDRYPDVEVTAIPMDVTNQASVDSAFATFSNDGAIKIDVLVSSAAEIGPREPVAQADGTAYLQTVNGNVAGALWLAQAFARYASPEDAVVIAISSWAAHWSAVDVFSAYCVAKIAVARLWDTLMLSNPGIRVVHTQPGVVLTEMNLREGGAKNFDGIPIDDVSLPASYNVWLASPEARFLKGKFVWCNWDVDELKAQATEIEQSSILNIGLNGWPFQIGSGPDPSQAVQDILLKGRQ